MRWKFREQSVRGWLLAAGLACVTGCYPEGSVIYETSPFYSVEADLPAHRVSAFVRASTDFARRRGLEFSVNEFGDGQFSVLLYDGPPASLNLVAVNTVSHGEVIISATARGEPTRAHFATVIAYVAAARPTIGKPRPLSN